MHDPRFAAIVEESLLYHDEERYRLLAWVVMPNHVHALIHPVGEWRVAKIVGTWKKHSSLKIGALRRSDGYRGSGHLWQREYGDRYIRNEKHYRQVVEYIHWNLVKARLVAKPEDWPLEQCEFFWERHALNGGSRNRILATLVSRAPGDKLRNSCPQPKTAPASKRVPR